MSIPLGDAIVRLLVDSAELQKGLNQAMGQVQQMGQSMTQVGKTMTLGLTLPIVGVGIAALKTATDFDASMRNMNSIAQLSEEQFQNMKEEVLDFSMTTRASSAEVADALTDVVAAGYEADAAFKILTASSRAAGAGLATIDDTSAALTATLASYNMTAEDSAMIMDKFLQIINLGRLDLPDLAAAIGAVLPIASSLGVTLDEVGAAMATMTNAGLTTQMSAFSLKSAITSLMKPTDELQAMIEEYGYESGAAMLKTEGLAGVLAMLQKETGGESDRLLTLLGNIRSVQGFTILLKEGTEGYTDALEKMGESEGAVERAREEQYKSLSAQLARLKASFEVVMITIGEMFIPTIIELVKALVPLVRSFRDIPKPLIKVGVAVAGVVAAIGPLLLIMGKVVTLSATLGPVIAGIVSTLGTILVPLGLLVGAGVLFYKAWTENWFGIQEIVKDAVGEILPILTGLRDTFSRILAGDIRFTMEDFRNIIENILGPEITQILDESAAMVVLYAGKFMDALTNLGNAVRPILSAVASGFVEFVGHVRSALSEFWSEIQPKLLAAWENIAPIIEGVANRILGIINGITAWFTEHKDTIIGIVRGLWTIVQGVFDTAFSIVGGLVKVFLDVLAGDWDAVKEDLIGIAEGIKGGLKTVFEGIKLSLGVIVGALIVTMKAKFLEMGDKISAAIMAKITDIKTAMRGIVQGAIDAAKEKIQGFYNLGKDFVQGLIDGLKAMLQPLLDAIQAVRNLLPGSLAETGPFSVPVEWDFVTEGLPDMLGRAQIGVEDLPSPAERVREPVPAGPSGDFIINIEGDIYGIEDFKNAVQDAMDEMAGRTSRWATVGSGGL